MLADLQSRLPDYAWLGRARDGKGADEHCAIFYRPELLTLQNNGQFWLSTTPEKPSASWQSSLPRICTWGHFTAQRAPDVAFLVCNTHLDHISQTAREQGAKLIWQFIDSYVKQHRVPAILLGDMNAEPSHRVIQFLRGKQAIDGENTQLSDASLITAATEPTFHGFGGTTRQTIDYLFVTPDISILSYQVDHTKHLDRYPSDHFPVLSELDIPHTKTIS